MQATAERADPDPARPAANDARAHDKPTDVRMSTRLERVDEREEVEVLDALRKRGWTHLRTHQRVES